MIKIGYQGIEGSNAEQAAHDLVEKLKLTDVEYVPLVDSQHVIRAMKTGETDYGVCAVYNSAAGMVLETFFATNGVELLIRGETTMNIHHCLFKKSPAVADESLKYVASHILALKQCEDHLKYQYPALRTVEVEDTAKAVFPAIGKRTLLIIFAVPLSDSTTILSICCIFLSVDVEQILLLVTLVSKYFTSSSGDTIFSTI